MGRSDYGKLAKCLPANTFSWGIGLITESVYWQAPLQVSVVNINVVYIGEPCNGVVNCGTPASLKLPIMSKERKEEAKQSMS